MDIDSIEPRIIEGLKARYGEAGRHYHDWSHIEALLRHFDAASDPVHDKVAVLHAILFHDVIYDAKAPDNEQRSADLMMAQELPITDASKELARDMIIATAKHELPDTLAGTDRSDTAHFLDMDLAILGAPEHYFARYEAQVRGEYAHVPDAGFLAREQLYFSEWGYSQFEDRARSNLKRSIAALEGGSA
jgi:predicted metal-dependent HD superfamily phosphohydrolase